jgi:hypothetical protein
MITGNVTLNIQFVGGIAGKAGKCSTITETPPTVVSTSNASITTTSKTQLIGVGIKPAPIAQSITPIVGQPSMVRNIYLLSYLGLITPVKTTGVKLPKIGAVGPGLLIINNGIVKKVIIKWGGIVSVKVGKTRVLFAADYLNINPPDINRVFKPGKGVGIRLPKVGRATGGNQDLIQYSNTFTFSSPNPVTKKVTGLKSSKVGFVKYPAITQSTLSFAFNTKVQANTTLYAYNKYQTKGSKLVLHSGIRPTKVGSATFKISDSFAGYISSYLQSNTNINFISKYQIDRLFKTKIVYTGSKPAKVGSATFNIGDSFAGYISQYTQTNTNINYISKYQIDRLFKTKIVFAGTINPSIGSAEFRVSDTYTGYISRYTQTNTNINYVSTYQLNNLYQNTVYNGCTQALVGSAEFRVSDTYTGYISRYTQTNTNINFVSAYQLNNLYQSVVYNSCTLPLVGGAEFRVANSFAGYQSQYSQINTNINYVSGYQLSNLYLSSTYNICNTALIGTLTYPITKTKNTINVYNAVNNISYIQTNVPIIKNYVGIPAQIVGTLIYPVAKTKTVKYVYSNDTLTYIQSNAPVIKDYVGVLDQTVGTLIYPVIKTANTINVYSQGFSRYTQNNTQLIKEYVGINIPKVGVTKRLIIGYELYISTAIVNQPGGGFSSRYAGPYKKSIGITTDSFTVSNQVPPQIQAAIANITSVFRGVTKKAPPFKCNYPPSLLYTRPYNDPTLALRPGHYAGKLVAKYGSYVIYDHILLPPLASELVVQKRSGAADKAGFVGCFVPRLGTTALYDRIPQVFADYLPIVDLKQLEKAGRIKIVGIVKKGIGSTTNAYVLNSDGIASSIANIQARVAGKSGFYSSLVAAPGRMESCEIIPGLFRFDYSYTPTHTPTKSYVYTFGGFNKTQVGYLPKLMYLGSPQQDYSYSPPNNPILNQAAIGFDGLLPSLLPGAVATAYISKQQDSTTNKYTYTPPPLQLNEAGIQGFAGCILPPIGLGVPSIITDLSVIYKNTGFFDQTTKASAWSYCGYNFVPVGTALDKIVDYYFDDTAFSYRPSFINDVSVFYNAWVGTISPAVGTGYSIDYIPSSDGKLYYDYANDYLNAKGIDLHGYTGCKISPIATVFVSDIIIPEGKHEYYYYLRNLLDSNIRDNIQRNQVYETATISIGGIPSQFIGSILDAYPVDSSFISNIGRNIQRTILLDNLICSGVTSTINNIVGNTINPFKLNNAIDTTLRYQSNIIADISAVFNVIKTVLVGKSVNAIKLNNLASTEFRYQENIIPAFTGEYKGIISTTNIVCSAIGTKNYISYNDTTLVQTNIITTVSNGIGLSNFYVGGAPVKLSLITGLTTNATQTNILPFAVSTGIGCVNVYVGGTPVKSSLIAGLTTDATQTTILPFAVSTGIGCVNVYVGGTPVTSDLITGLITNTLQDNIVPDAVSTGIGCVNVYVGGTPVTSDLITGLISNTLQDNIVPAVISTGIGCVNVYVGNTPVTSDLITGLITNTLQDNIVPDAVSTGIGCVNVYVGGTPVTSDLITGLISNTLQDNIVPDAVSTGIGCVNVYIGNTLDSVNGVVGTINTDNIQNNTIPSVIRVYSGFINIPIGFTESDLIAVTGELDTTIVQDNIIPDIITTGIGLTQSYIGSASTPAESVGELTNNIQDNIVPADISVGIGIVNVYIGATLTAVKSVGELTNTLQDNIIPEIITVGISVDKIFVGNAFVERLVIEGELSNTLQDSVLPSSITAGIGLINTYVGNALAEHLIIIGEITNTLQDNIIPSIISDGVGFVTCNIGWTEHILVENIGDLGDINNHYIQTNDRLKPISDGVGFVTSNIGWTEHILVKNIGELGDINNVYVQTNDRLKPISDGVGFVTSNIGWTEHILVENIGDLGDINNRYIQTNDKLKPISDGVGFVTSSNIGHTIGNAISLNFDDIIITNYNNQDNIVPELISIGVGLISNIIGSALYEHIESIDIDSGVAVLTNDIDNDIIFGVGLISNIIGSALYEHIESIDIDSGVAVLTNDIDNDIIFGVGIVSKYSIGHYEVVLPPAPWSYPEHPELIIFNSISTPTYGIILDKYNNEFTVMPKQQLESIGIPPEYIDFNSVGYKGVVIITQPATKPFKLYQYWS